MKYIITALFLSMSLSSVFAVRLSDYGPYEFEVLFTNPVCKTYKYDRPMVTVNGDTITAKPDDVYCKTSDERASVKRKNAPQYRLIEWISDKNTKELYLAYLSFRSKNVANALCKAAERGVKISFVLDQNPKKPRVNSGAEKLKKCAKREDQVSVTYRGNTGGLGYAHNKIMIVNPGKKIVRIVYSSGNMTTGTSINHENWNFITTSGESFFAQTHKCVVEAMIEAGDTKKNFSRFLNDCRRKIKAEPESDVQVFFSPTDGNKAFNTVKNAGLKAEKIEAMSHRFSGKVARLFEDLLDAGRPIKFILDDDVYWAERLKEEVGRNTKYEAFKLYNDLIHKGMETRFLQTNQQIYQLQHNKIMIFHFEKGGAVFNGAGNFTSSAFTKNFENFYYITIPEVVEAYKKQYDRYFNEMATAFEDMPRNYVLP